MNHLQHETSPYLLQHAHNPVDWYAWKHEAFERARAEQKPILVSIGYSTCHWCHVMERESFENEGIARYMNEHYVNIKVDREERPDVDAIYMEACQILTGGGGWPLNCFLTPDGKPFYAGTYFPPKPAHNRPSWLQLLEHLSNIWETQRDVAIEQGEKLLGHIKRNDDLFIKAPALQTALAAPAPPSPPIRRGAVNSSVEDTSVAPDNVDKSTDASTERLTELLTAGGLGGAAGQIFFVMRERFDRTDGGFGGAPKFPSTMAIRYLLSFHYLTGNKEALDHACLSLDKMIHGGIYDQLGGGFARYATDSEWLVPHFEKMLYDNALLVTVLSDAYKVTGSQLYKETISETLEYIKREMTHPEGGFYSAQDADSEGVEGKFFVWDKAEVEQILGEEAELFCTFYDVTEKGNWEEKNILWRLENYEAFAAGIQMDVDLLKNKLQVCREKLFAVRKNRIHPGLDDKILLGWNGLMSSAYATAFTALGEEEYRTAAIRNMDFILTRFSAPHQSPPSTVHRPPSTVPFLHVWKNGLAQYPAFLEDYAFLIAALIDVYQISFDVSYLQTAEKYTELVLSYFKDDETGLFFITGAGQSDIILRKKDLYDNATPSGNSTMVHNLQRLGILLDRRDWREQTTAMLLSMKESVERYPLSFERWATTMLNEEFPIQEIAVVGTNAAEKALLLQRRFIPNMVIAAASETSDALPLLAEKTAADDALVYVCRDFSCQRPVTTLEEVFAML